MNGFNRSSTIAIVNPRAGKRRTVYLPQGIEILQTKAPGHATQLARTAIKSGVKTIIAVGGDGTINEVVNGFFEGERAIPTDAGLAIIPQGSGSDFSRVLNLPHDPRLVATIIENGEKRLIDLMKVRYTTPAGTSAVRYSINVTSFGMGGAVADRVNRSSKALGPRLAFLGATLKTALGFSGRQVTLHLDGSKTLSAKILNVAIGNGQYHGAGMWVCPGAILDDGLLDVTVIRYVGLIELIRNIGILYNGGIYSYPKVESFRVKSLRAESLQRTLLEIDGESIGRLPLEVSVVPNAIRLYFR